MCIIPMNPRFFQNSLARWGTSPLQRLFRRATRGAFLHVLFRILGYARAMNKQFFWALVVIGLLVVGVFFYLLFHPRVENLEETGAFAQDDKTAGEVQSAADTAPQTMTAKIALIALEDAGATGVPVGCGDSAVLVSRNVPQSAGVLRAALTELLSLRGKDYGSSGLYNALGDSQLSIEEVSMSGSTATIRLTGTVSLGGECDTPRFKAQIEETARQFPTVKDVAVFINGIPMEEALSLK